MIKIGQHIRINILTIILFVVCIITHKGFLLSLAYLTAFFHETAHFAAAKAIGLRVDNITFHPFGVNMQLKNKVIYGLCDEIILYAAGPAFNIVCAFLLSRFTGKYTVIDYLYSCNIVMFFINSLPILPLDGGVILKKIIAHFTGYRAAQKCLRISSAILIAALIITECIAAFKSGINYSVILMIVFLTGNIFTQSEKYDIDFVRELMYSEKKSTDKVKLFVARDNTSLENIAKKFTEGKYGVVIFVNDDGEITNTLTEKQIIKSVINTENEK